MSGPLVSATSCGFAVIALGVASHLVHRSTHLGLVAQRLAGKREAVVPAWFLRTLRTFDLHLDPSAALTLATLLSGLFAVALVLLFPQGAVVLLCGVVAAVLLRRFHPRHLADGAFEDDLLACVGEMSSCLASGSSLLQAVGAAGRREGPAALGLAAVHRSALAGAPLQESIDVWAASCHVGNARSVADALAVTAATGASQVLALDAVADTLRRRAIQAQDIRSLSSQAKASAVVLLAVPIGFSATAGILDPRVGRFLLATPLGWACMVGGLLLDAAGAAWMRALLRRVS